MTDVVDPVLPVVVKTFTVQTAPQQAIPSGSSLATPTISPDASEPSAQVAARWPSTAEAFTPIAGSPSVGSRSYRSASPVLPSRLANPLATLLQKRVSFRALSRSPPIIAASFTKVLLDAEQSTAPNQ